MSNRCKLFKPENVLGHGMKTAQKTEKTDQNII